MRKISKLFLVFVLCVIFMVGCSGSSDKEETPSGEPTSVDMSGEKKVDLGDLTAEDLKVYPSEKYPSMYFYSAQPMVDEVFFGDQQDIVGTPYYFNGTILEEVTDLDDFFGMNEESKQFINSGVETKAFKIMTDKGAVIVIDVVPEQINYMKNAYGSNVNAMTFYKRLYTSLTPYKNYPEIGTTGCFYGFYFGYNSKSECPVFSYGVSRLARRGLFPIDYQKYITEDTKHFKYRNLFEMDYSVGWSDDITGDEKYFFSCDEYAYLYVQDWEEADWSLEEAMDMIMADLNGETGDPDSDFNMDDYIRINSKQKKAIGQDGTIESYILEYSYKANDGAWYDETLVLFYTKRNLILLNFYEFTGESDGEQPAKAEDGTSLYKKEFYAILDTIKLCGY